MARRTAHPSRSLGSLVAAATRLKIERTTSGTVPTEQWQQGMWAIYDETPEVHYGLNFKRSSTSRVSFFAAEWTDDPEADPEPTTNPQVVEAVEQLDQGQGLAEMVAELVVHLDVAGEGYVVGCPPDRVPGNENTIPTEPVVGDLAWHAYAPREIATTEWAQLFKADTAIAYRVWRPHPADGKRPDSPLRAISNVAAELFDLSALGRAQARSRIPAGILFLAQDLKIQQDDSDPNGNDSIAVELGQHLINPIQDMESAGSVVPLIVEGPRDMIAKGQGWDFLDMARPMEDLSDRQERLIRRLAAGLDLPAEIILGMADINHWGAWLIDEQAVKTHVDPPIRLIIQSLTDAFLRQMLIEQGMAPVEASRYLIWRDLSHLVQHQDRSSAARELFRLGAVGFETLRQANGFGPEDAPSVDEMEVMGWLLGRGNPSTGQLVDLPGGEPSGVSAPPEPADVQQGPPLEAVAAAASPAPITLSDLAAIDSATFDQLTEAIEAAIQKAMERAGSRIRNQTRKDRVVSASIDGVDNRRVALTVGQRTAFQLVPEDELVTADDFGQLREQAARILSRGQSRVRSALGKLNVEPPTETETAGWLRRAVEYVTAAALALTLRRLFTAAADPDPLDGEASDVAVPAVDVWATLTIAGGGTPETFQPDTPRGIGLGPDTRQRLAADGYQTVRYEWAYGDASSRRTNFPPHESLDGFQFASWTDERLTSHTSWLSVTHYYPGDHRGCRCQAVPVVVESAPER